MRLVFWTISVFKLMAPSKYGELSHIGLMFFLPPRPIVILPKRAFVALFISTLRACLLTAIFVDIPHYLLKNL